MPKFNKLSDLTAKQLDEYILYLETEEAKKIIARRPPPTTTPPSEPKQHATHDVFNIYRYGDIIKVVYLKTCPAIKTGERSKKSKIKGKAENAEQSAERFAQSLSRTRARIFELAACNEFTHFCTFTQDKEKRDRFNLTEFREDFAQLVRNLNRSRAAGDKIKYLLIPEKHKKGGWHMHGFLKGLTPDDLRLFTLDEKLPQRLRKQLKEGAKIYDWTRYRRSFGYFTCTEIENGTAAAKYITKYVTKDVAETVRKSGAHLFFASQGLKGRKKLEWRSFDKCPVDNWDFENDFVKVKEYQLDRATGELKSR